MRSCLLEQELNSAIMSLYDNINIIRKLVGAREPYFLSPTSTGMNEEIVIDISRLDLKRAAFSVEGELKRLDKDLLYDKDSLKDSMVEGRKKLEEEINTDPRTPARE